MKKVFWAACALGLMACAEKSGSTRIEYLPGEKWWGPAAAAGSQMPYGTTPKVDLATEAFGNQSAPLLVSNKGRYVWSDEPFVYEFGPDALTLTSHSGPIGAVKAGETLRDAYLAASEKHFPPSGTLPADLFFSKPQYNTWIELLYDQSQEKVLRYARDIVANGFPVGVLMIDDNWQKYYGNFEFKPETFPDPAALVKELHGMGFKVMLWITPFVSPDSREFRALKDKGYLVMDKEGREPALISWWNGTSAAYDLSNPKAYAHLRGQLASLQEEFGIDGFKFDAGDPDMYREDAVSVFDGRSYGAAQTELWVKMGLGFPYNEYRASWKMGGQPVVQRLRDKAYSWEDAARLVPDMLAIGLIGHPYACPDMIGGGEFGSFLNITGDFDQRLIVRSCQIHAMMPMMQFSVAPWRVLDKKHLDICIRYARWHEQLGDYILELAHHASRTGEPIARHMEYAFPGQGFETCRDQFMLGDRYLVAPVLDDKDTRTVRLPAGKWRDDQGNSYEGGREYTIDAPIERLPWFEPVD